MTTTTPAPDLVGPPSDGPRFAAAGTFLEGLAAQDFDRLATTLAPDVHLRALVPPGLREWTGAADVAGQFGHWFGDTEQFDLVDGSIGEVADRLHLRWRLRLRAERLGDGWFAVEQQAYIDTDPEGHIARIDLLCTGYRPAGAHG